jgi:hypothetical protein
MNLKIGDHVRVAGLPSSQWHGLSGIVVDLVQHPSDGQAAGVQECGVNFGSSRCWFLSQHLVKVTPVAERFVRSELLIRWPSLLPDDVNRVSGSRDDLICLLQERYGLARTRAAAEADNFLSHLRERVRLAA